MRMLLLRTNKVKSSVKQSFIKPKRALIPAVIALGITAMTKLRPLPFSIKSIKGARLLAVLIALFLFSQIYQMAGVGRNLKNSKWIVNADNSAFTRQQPTNCPTCKPPSTDHYLNFAYFSEDGDMTSTLTLNNNKNEATEVKITIFNSKGEPFRLAPINLASQQVSRFSVRELAKGARGDFKSGNIQVFYHGPAMGVTGQVSIISTKERISFESSPTEAMMFTSTTLDGIVWVPDEKTKASVALTNTASSTITVTAISRRDSQGWQKALTLEPRETQVLNLNEFIDKQKGLPAAALVSLTHSGAAGDLITTGFTLNDKTGFGCDVAFIDRSRTKSNRLAGAHLRLGPARPEEGFPSGTTFQSPLVIANAGSLPTEVKIAVDYTVNTVARRVELAPLALAAQEIKQIDLAQEMAQRSVVGFVDNAGVDISYTGAAGSVIGRLTSVDTTGDFSFEVPIKDPLAGMNRVGGSYPWRLDGGYTTVLHLKNTLDKEVHAIVQLRYDGGTYNPGRVKLAPYQTVAVDIRQLRDSQQKDVRGGTIPTGLTGGKVIWYEEKIGSLIGRAEVSNAGAAVVSSFSCSGPCNCPPDFNRSFMSPESYPGLSGEVGSPFLPTYTVIDCDLLEMGPFPPSEISSWVSSDESVGTVESQGTVSCLESGLAYIYATFPTVTYTYFSGTCLENTSSTTSAGQLIVARLTGSVDNPPVFGDSNGGIAGQAFTFRVRAVHPTTGQQVGASGTSTVDFPSLRSGESINPNPVNVSAGAGTTQVVLRVVDDASSGRTYTLLAGGATPGAGQVNLWFPVEMDIERWRNCNFQSCPNLGSYNCMTACVPSGFSQRTEFIALTARVCNRSVWVSYTGPGGSSVSKLTTVQDVGPTTNNPYWNTGNIPGTAGCLSDLLADELGVPNGCNPGPFGRASVLWRFQ